MNFSQLSSLGLKKIQEQLKKPVVVGTTCGVIGISSFLLLIKAKQHDNLPLCEGYKPIIGHYLYMIIQNWDHWYETEVEQFKKLGQNQSIFAVCLPLNFKLIYIADPELIKYTYTDKFKEIFKGRLKEPFYEILGDGIFNSDGVIWERQRKYAARIFTMKSLKDYMFEIFMNASDQFIDKCRQLNDEFGSIDFFDMFNRMTLDAFVQISFGESLHVIESAPKLHDFSEAFDRSFTISMERWFDPLWKIKKLFHFTKEQELIHCIQHVDEIVNKIIKKKRLEYNEQEQNKINIDDSNSINYKLNLKKYCNLLSIFLNEVPNITDKELRDVATNFIIAGRDTTAQTLSWLFYCLNQKENQHIIEKILQELNQNIKWKDNNTNFDYNDINNCHYLENCLLETLRLYPSVPHLLRSCYQDVQLPGKYSQYTIRKGDDVVIACWSMGRLPWLWENPHVFDPTRFEKHQYQPHEYPIFNLPPRLCLGKHVALLEAKITAAKILKNFIVEVLPNQNITYVFSATNIMKHGMKVKLTPRNQQSTK